MKALSVQQPWALLLLTLADPADPIKPLKPVENRTWELPANMYGQRVLIHAGLKMDTIPMADLEEFMTPEQRNRIQPDLLQMYYYYLANEKDNAALRRSGWFGCIMGETDIVAQVTSHPSPFFSGPYGFLTRRPVALSGR